MKTRTWNRKYSIVAVVLMLVAMIFGGVSIAEAAIIEKDEISIDQNSKVTITNAEGETIIADPRYGISGTMEILDKRLDYRIPISNYKLKVRSSKSYLYEKRGKGSSNVVFDHKEGKSHVSISLEKTGRAKVFFEPEGRVELEGPPQNYWLSVSMNDGGSYYLVGKLKDKLTVMESGSQVVVNGISGKTLIEIESPDGKIYSEDAYYYVFGGSTTLGYTSKGTYVTNAARIPDSFSKTPDGIYLRPANNGKNMFLTWKKIEKARSYIVYRYDPAKKKYKREAVRNGQESNYYVTDADQKGIYRYKILARSGKNGTGKNIGKLSYYVSSVTDSSSKGNVVETKIRSAKKTLTIKKGKKKKLNAVVYGNGKPLYNKSIRWYSSNDKVAKINNKTGKIKAKKKGSCYVWAKAHNGKNSSRIKIVVK